MPHPFPEPAGSGQHQSARRNALGADCPQHGPHLGEGGAGDSAHAPGRGHRGAAAGIRPVGHHRTGTHPAVLTCPRGICRDHASVRARHPHANSAAKALSAPGRHLPDGRRSHPCPRARGRGAQHRHQQSGCALFRGRFLHPGHRRTVLQGPPVQSVPDFGAHPGPGCRPSGEPQQLVQSGLCGGTAVHGLWRKNGCAAACC